MRYGHLNPAIANAGNQYVRDHLRIRCIPVDILPTHSILHWAYIALIVWVCAISLVQYGKVIQSFLLSFHQLESTA